MGVTFWAWPNVAFHFHMAHPVVNVTEEQAAAAIAGLDPDKEPYVLVCMLRKGAWVHMASRLSG
jgi:hypothetical protein